MTRHKKLLTVYANKKHQPTLSLLTNTLKRHVTCENIVDYQISFAVMRGSNVDNIIRKLSPCLRTSKNMTRLSRDEKATSQ